jgi:hypothetical protein
VIARAPPDACGYVCTPQNLTLLEHQMITPQQSVIPALDPNEALAIWKDFVNQIRPHETTLSVTKGSLDSLERGVDIFFKKMTDVRDNKTLKAESPVIHAQHVAASEEELQAARRSRDNARELIRFSEQEIERLFSEMPLSVMNAVPLLKQAGSESIDEVSWITGHLLSRERAELKTDLLSLIEQKKPLLLALLQSNSNRRQNIFSAAEERILIEQIGKALV